MARSKATTRGSGILSLTGDFIATPDACSYRYISFYLPCGASKDQPH
jgi:hypothetical protein